MTLAECGPDSLYDEFLAKLGDVRTYVRPDGSDRLVLNLFADAGNMFFRPAQAAQLPEEHIRGPGVAVDSPRSTRERRRDRGRGSRACTR